MRGRHSPGRRNSPHPEFRDISHFSAVETLRQLILRDLEEEGWSHDSDDTPTNEANSERSPLSGTVLRIAEEGEPEEDVRRQDEEPPSFQVVRKGRKNRFLTKEPNLKSSAKEITA